MKNHALWMLIGCTLPLLFIFFAPAFGINNNIATFLFIVLMFGCHIFMMKGHGHHHHDDHKDHDKK